VRDAEALVQHASERTDAERAQVEYLNALSLKPVEPERERLEPRAPGEEHDDRFRTQASNGVRERSRRSRVEPLSVVDRKQDASARGKRAKHGQDRDCDRIDLGRRPVRLFAEERDRERAPLRRRQLVRDVV